MYSEFIKRDLQLLLSVEPYLYGAEILKLTLKKKLLLMSSKKDPKDI